jgi:hypothetical protein
MDEKKSSSWDELIEQLGAAPQPDALERRRPAIENEFEPPPVAPAPKNKPSDWNALADQLGVEVSESVQSAPRSPSAAADESATAEAMEASFLQIEPMESAFEEIITQELAEIDFAESEEQRGSEGAEDSSTLSGEAARSAFEALFQAGSFLALPPLAEPRKPEGKPGPQWRDVVERPSRRPSEPSEDQKHELAEGSDAGDEGASEEHEHRPRRRRRRGRGGRGREKDDERMPQEANEQGEWSETFAEHEDDEALAGNADNEEGEADERPRRRRRRRGRSGSPTATDRQATESGPRERRSRDDHEDDEDDDDSPLEDLHDEDDEGDDSPKRGSHKNIPTWSEAIGVMVETNLLSRKSSPQRPGPSRERGRGRGRGRGGRGHR